MYRQEMFHMHASYSTEGKTELGFMKKDYFSCLRMMCR